MMDTSDIIAFCFTIFIALTFTFAGVYLTDELSPANQLHQLFEGHQLTYHEDKYGFYPDGSVDRSITGANYVMTYALLSPVLSIPVLTVLSFAPDASRLVPLIFWIICFMFMLNWLFENKKYVYAIGTIVIVSNFIFYKSFDIGNIEIVAIVLTNTFLYGLFGMMVWKIISRMICEDYARIFSWIAVMSCSSLLFWVGALKDHVIVALLFIILIYMFMKYHEIAKFGYEIDIVNLLGISISTGLLIWERPELSVVLIPFICLYLIYMHKTYILPLIMFGVFTAISSLPTLINNYIVTGSVAKFPFQAVNQTLGGAHFLSSSTVYDVLFHEFPAYFIANLSQITLTNIIGILIVPLNGGIGILPILLLPLTILLLIPYFKKVKKFTLNSDEKILIFFSSAIIFMYLFTSYLGFRLHTESGILPDMRYYSIIYAPLTIASMSIISRVFQFDYRKMIKRYIISLSVMMVIFAGLLMFIFNNEGVIYTNNIDIVANIICIGLFGILLAMMISLIRKDDASGLSYLIPVLISLPAAWQIFISVIIQKVYMSPMFIPIMQVLKNFVFS